MKSLIGKLGMLALLATATGAVVAGCSSSQVPSAGNQGSDGPQGEVTLKLVPVSGVTLNTVHYVVKDSSGGPVAEGDLPTPGTAKDFSFGLQLPVGTGYNLSLSAASAEVGDDITCTGASAPFNVTSNNATAFSLTLTCVDNTNGSIIGNVDVKTDACPKIVFDYVVATPATAKNVAPDNKIAVAAKAHDLDGKALTYSWKIATPAVGSFAPVTGADSVLTCLGPQGLGEVVTVTAGNGECTKTLTTTVSCKSVECGDGVLQPDEQCDTALPGPCPSDCKYACGDGVAEAPVEDCDPGSATNPVCTEQCKFRPVVCGDGFINGTEACDIKADGTQTFPAGTPAGSTCSADCKTVTSPVIKCGDGVITAPETCDDGTGAATATGVSPKCSNTCQKVSTQACVDCENAGDCFESVNNCLGVDIPFGEAQQTACFSVISCIQNSNCLDGTGSLGSCYCGTLETGPCGAAPFTGAGSPNGPCVDVIKAGFPTFTTNQDILGGLFATDFPSGAAMKRLNCQKTANSSACLTTCGLNTGGPAFP